MKAKFAFAVIAILGYSTISLAANKVTRMFPAFVDRSAKSQRIYRASIISCIPFPQKPVDLMFRNQFIDDDMR